jgi:saccharopine dehydrogenase-like NADP-dependent oxidoreductase
VADLANDPDFQVTVADAAPAALERAAAIEAVRTIQADLADVSTVRQLASDHELVIGAVPGPIGFQTLEAVVDVGVNYVDIAFFAEDPLVLDGAAKESGVIALVDCGVAPGLSNLILGYHAGMADRVERFVCYVGGLPVDRGSIFQYKATFSPVDVIAEYTRPARYVEGGEVLEVPALSQVELIDFPEVGELEAFLTDGLRTLVDTTDAPNMREKTLRYPGHADHMRLLREMGLFDADPVTVGGVQVRPLQFTAELLFPLWQFEPGEADLTVMRVEVDTVTGDERQRHTYDLLDRYDPTSQTASMARTTGYTCTALARLVAQGSYDRPGVSPPELVGREPGCFQMVVADLEAHGISLDVATS